ncbi:YhcH/YjgK/YiaL family protein [Paenibacillus hodogayensis]|uniref:YhcH/YjgK/YiaL family protein n=1 Tax=Paenibacillus hodogayensis TaxID=279208 RepID=A0ABV5VYT6_9BACL
MFWGHIDNWEQEKCYYPIAIQNAMDHIRSLDFDRIPDGKYELEGGLVTVSIKETTTRERWLQKAETHRTYVDIQYVIRGEEKIGVAPWSPVQTVVRDDLDARDVAFYEPVHGEIELHQKPGMYAVFFPTDIHRPCCSVAEDAAVRRMVIKMHSRLFEETGVS